MPEDGILTVSEEDEEVQGIEPFTLEDSDDAKACADCKSYKDCAILAYVNKLSLKRDGKKVDYDFKCTIFRDVD